jgi:flagellar biosynthesis protein FlhG
MKDGTRTISITSGKGGVGKTTLVCNIASELGRMGKRVLILDGDLGMANVDIMFGVRSHSNIGHVLAGQAEMDEVITEVAPNVHLIPGGSGVYGLNKLETMQKQMLMDQVSRMNRNYDYMLIDTAPGIDDHVLYLNSAAQEILVTVTPDPTSLTDAYALIKVLHQRYRENHFSVITNMVRDEADGRQVFQKLSEVADRFLCVSLNYRGFVPNDLILRQSIRNQRPVVQMQSRCPSARAFQTIAENLKDSRRFSEVKGGMQFFWNQISGVA